jgi:hypothetical protein
MHKKKISSVLLMTASFAVMVSMFQNCAPGEFEVKSNLDQFKSQTINTKMQKCIANSSHLSITVNPLQNSSLVRLELVDLTFENGEKSVQWDFGDGQETKLIPLAEGTSVEYEYANLGELNPTVTVFDENGPLYCLHKSFEAVDNSQGQMLLGKVADMAPACKAGTSRPGESCEQFGPVVPNGKYTQTCSYFAGKFNWRPCVLNGCAQDFSPIYDKYRKISSCEPMLCKPNVEAPCTGETFVGTMRCDPTGLKYYSCQLKQCKDGFVRVAGAGAASCKPKVCDFPRTVAFESEVGVGYKTCLDNGSRINPNPVYTSCKPGYQKLAGNCSPASCSFERDSCIGTMITVPGGISGYGLTRSTQQLKKEYRKSIQTIASGGSLKIYSISTNVGTTVRCEKGRFIDASTGSVLTGIYGYAAPKSLNGCDSTINGKSAY